MKKFIKANLVLVLAFALPLILLLSVFAVTYLPSLFVSTDYSFIYATCTDSKKYYSYDCEEELGRLEIINNKLVKHPSTSLKDSGVSLHFFIHDNVKNESREVLLNQVQQYNLSKLVTSPDGYTVIDKYSPGLYMFPFFDTSSDYGYYLSKGNNNKRLNLVLDDVSYYRRNYKFIGWVI